MRSLIKTTLIGGVLFLVPLVFIVVLGGKAFEILHLVVSPLSDYIPAGYFGGYMNVAVLTILLMFVLCLLAGLIARSDKAKVLYAKFDNFLLQLIPGYAWTKGITGGLSDEEAETVLKPVLVRFDDQCQIGFEVDRTENGLVAVYMPAAPNAREGSISFVEADRVESIKAGLGGISKSYKNLGRGSAALLADGTG